MSEAERSEERIVGFESVRPGDSVRLPGNVVWPIQRVRRNLEDGGFFVKLKGQDEIKVKAGLRVTVLP